MKKIVSGNDLKEKMVKSIELLCGTVKQTLGPKGNNVLIDHSTFSPFITNDGVTIAQNIEDEDEAIGAILEIIKEASIKTNEEVGDGTTTTLVLLESIFLQSLKHIEKGVSPISLKKELDMTLEVILKELYKLKRKPTFKDLKNIAYVSAGEEKLASLAYQAIKKVKQKEAVVIKEVSQNKNSISYLNGYICEIDIASPYFLKDSNVAYFKDSYILLLNTTLSNLENISFILNDILENKKDLIIIANSYDENIVENIVALFLTENINICLVKLEEYGINIYKVLKDIEIITNAKIIDNENFITSKDIGIAKEIQITKDKIKIDFQGNDKSKSYLEQLKKECQSLDNDLEKEFYRRRIAGFLNGSAEIKLGAPTKTERIEKRMRLDDALCALSVANEGILAGCGISLLQISGMLNSENEANKIWKEALMKPFEQILINSGLNFLEIKKQVEKENYKTIYNISDNVWENINETKVIDPFLVIMHSLINANSIAGMLLTTTSLIINEYKNNGNKESEYNNW